MAYPISHGLPTASELPGNPSRASSSRARSVACPEGIDRFSVGDAVFGTAAGAFAEMVSVPVTALAPKSPQIAFEQAATVSISGLTALQAVRDGGRVAPGQHVLVIGASGGVGSYAVQIAKAFGARVTGVASTRNLELLRELGADHVVDYTRDDPTAVTARYDVIIDIAGNNAVSHLGSALVKNGSLVMVGGTGGRWTMGFERTIGGMLLAPLVGHRIVGLLAKTNQADLQALADLIAKGMLSPVVQRSFPLSDAAEAVEAAGTGHGTGTVVLTV